MSKIDSSTLGKSIWKPQFIEEINQDICLDCDLFNEIGGHNASRLQLIDSDNNSEHQVMTVANPEQCANCDVCTSIYPKNAYAPYYSFSV